MGKSWEKESSHHIKGQVIEHYITSLWFRYALRRKKSKHDEYFQFFQTQSKMILKEEII